MRPVPALVDCGSARFLETANGAFASPRFPAPPLVSLDSDGSFTTSAQAAARGRARGAREVRGAPRRSEDAGRAHARDGSGPKSLPALRQQEKALDPNRQSSNLLTDYDAILRSPGRTVSCRPRYGSRGRGGVRTRARRGARATPDPRPVRAPKQPRKCHLGTRLYRSDGLLGVSDGWAAEAGSVTPSSSRAPRRSSRDQASESAGPHRARPGRVTCRAFGNEWRPKGGHVPRRRGRFVVADVVHVAVAERSVLSETPAADGARRQEHTGVSVACRHLHDGAANGNRSHGRPVYQIQSRSRESPQPSKHLRPGRPEGPSRAA